MMEFIEAISQGHFSLLYYLYPIFLQYFILLLFSISFCYINNMMPYFSLFFSLSLNYIGLIYR